MEPIKPLPTEKPAGPSLGDHDEAHEIRQAPAMPNEPSAIERILQTKLFGIPGWLAIVFAGLAWVLATFLGISGANVADWAGADNVMTLGELLGGLIVVVGGALGVKVVKEKKAQ